MPKRKKIIVAGHLVMEAIYPVATRWDSPKARSAKKHLSTEAQKRMNAKYSYQKLELMLAANFVPGDLFCTFTFRPELLPKDRKACEARFKDFRAKLAKECKKNGEDLRAVWAIEHKHGEAAWHIHCVLNNAVDYAAITAAWGRGMVDIRKLRLDGDQNYESLARYMSKEEREHVGLRSWSYTRTCRHPEIEIFPVDDDTPLQAPKGSTVIEEAGERTEYGSYRYIKYLVAWDAKPRKRRRMRRRK